MGKKVLKEFRKLSKEREVPELLERGKSWNGVKGGRILHNIIYLWSSCIEHVLKTYLLM